MESLSQLLVNGLKMANDPMRFNGKSVGKLLESVFLFNKKGSMGWGQWRVIHSDPVPFLFGVCCMKI